MPPNLPSLYQRYRQQTPTAPDRLLILGETTFRHQHQRFGLLPPDRLRHLWLLGKTGSGKSTLMANLVIQDLRAGHGLALLDPHAELVAQVQAHVAVARTAAVLLFDPADTAYPVGFNIFRQGEMPHPRPALLVAEIIAVFRSLWPAYFGPRMEYLFRNAILAMSESPDATLLSLYRFLTDASWRQRRVEKLKDRVVRLFWAQEFSHYPKALQQEALSPVLNKLGAFVTDPTVRNIVGQVRSKLDVGALIRNRGLILAPLAAGAIGDDAARLLGGLLLATIQLSAWETAADSTPTRPPFYVYLDEFQKFLTDNVPTLLSESRKFGLGLVLAHQYLDQLPAHLQSAVMGNVGSMMLFRLGASDAAVLSPELDPPFTALDLESLPVFETAVRLIARGQPLAPFSARTLPAPRPPPDADERVRAIRAHSRARFARPRSEVEQAIRGQIG